MSARTLPFIDSQPVVLHFRVETALGALQLVDVAERVGLPERKTAEVRSFGHETNPSGVLGQSVRAEHRHHSQRG